MSAARHPLSSLEILGLFLPLILPVVSNPLAWGVGEVFYRTHLNTSPIYHPSKMVLCPLRQLSLGGTPWSPSSPCPLPFFTVSVAPTPPVQKVPCCCRSVVTRSYGRGSTGLSSARSPVPPATRCVGPSCPSSPRSSMKNACWGNAQKHQMEGTRVLYQNSGLKFHLYLTIHGSYQKMEIQRRQQGILQTPSLWGVENKVIGRRAVFPFPSGAKSTHGFTA